MSASSAWLDAYHAHLTRGGSTTPKPPGVHCCAVCCTIFSLFGAVFMFILGGLMNSEYHYIHIGEPGHMSKLSPSVVYAGVIYLVCALISVFFWVRAAIRTGQFARASAFNQLQ